MALRRSDLVTAEIVRNYLETVSGEMGTIVENTATSPIFSEAHDYSTGIFYYDARGINLVARAQAIPVHIFAALTSVETALAAFSESIKPGDTFFVSDPYFGGSHIPDWTIVQPVLHNGKPLFFASVRGHLNDVGGCAPGGYNTEAREIWHEGFRCSPVKIYEDGKPVKDIFNLIVSNTRQKEALSGDLQAMVGASIVGARRVEEIIAKYGVESVSRSVDYALDYSEARLRAEIGSWPDGIYHGESILDHDFANGGPVPVRATVEVKGDSLIIDLNGSHGQVPGFCNSVYANTISNIYSSLVAICPDIPVNSGYFRPVQIKLPSHSVVNADSPAPVGHSTVCIGSDIMEAVMKAFEHIVPQKVGSANIDLCNFRVFGINSRTGKYFLSGDINTSAASSGGVYGVDGWGGWAAPFCALKLPPLEMYESEFPFQYLQMEFVTDTAAPGRWRGAPAVHYRRRVLDPVRGIGYVQGLHHPMQGYCGGKSGAGNYFVVNEGLPSEVFVEAACYNLEMPAGSVLFAQSGGGGGWGDPLERDPDAVLEDVLNELVSIAGAERDYGVVIDRSTMQVNREQTLGLRVRRKTAADASESRAP
jgi:N-methylhydantoinase B